MKKQVLSLFLCVVMVFVAVVAPRTPLRQTAQAAEGDTVTLSDGYTYIVEPDYMSYDATHPNQYLLFTTDTVNNWYKYDTYLQMSPHGTSSGAPSGNGYINFTNAAGGVTGIHYDVLKRDASYGNGSLADESQKKIMDGWGVNKMCYFYTDDSDMNAAGGTGVFDGTVTGGGGWHYYYNLKFKFPSPVDLTKFTHVYFDYWITSGYVRGTPGQLNIAFWDNSGNSEVDGFEYNIDFSTLDPDDDGKVNTAHRAKLDLRIYGTTASLNNQTINLNSIDGVTFRYMTPTSNMSQYNSATTPRIYFGKMFAYIATDNWHPGFAWGEPNGTDYILGANTNSPEPQQATMVALVGQNRWNQNTKIVFPAWTDFDGYRVMTLAYGDRETSTTDYAYGFLDRYSWRWGRYGVTNASNTIGVSFPASPLTGGGGSQAVDIRYVATQWLSDTTHGSFIG